MRSLLLVAVAGLTLAFGPGPKPSRPQASKAQLLVTAPFDVTGCYPTGTTFGNLTLSTTRAGSAAGYANGASLTCTANQAFVCDSGLCNWASPFYQYRGALPAGRGLRGTTFYTELQIIQGTGLGTLLDANLRGIWSVNEGASGTNANSAYLTTSGSGTVVFNVTDAGGQFKRITCTPSPSANDNLAHSICTKALPSGLELYFDGVSCGVVSGTGTGKFTYPAEFALDARGHPDTLTSALGHGQRNVRIWEGNAACPVPTKYATFGDSMTLGVTPVVRTPLAAGLQLDYGIGNFVHNFGVNSYTAAQTYARWVSLAKGRGYRGLTVWAGVNDAGGDTVIHTTQTNLAKLWFEAAAEGMTVVPITVAPWKPAAAYWSQPRQIHTDSLNDWIRRQAAINGLDYVDAYALLGSPFDPQVMNSTYDSGDDIHPGQAGHDVIRAAVRPLLRSRSSRAFPYLVNVPFYYSGACVAAGTQIGTHPLALVRLGGGNATGYFDAAALSCTLGNLRVSDWGAQFNTLQTEVVRFSLPVGKTLSTYNVYAEWAPDNAFLWGNALNRGLFGINEGASASNANSATFWLADGSMFWRTIDGSGASRTVTCPQPADDTATGQAVGGYHAIIARSTPTSQQIEIDGAVCGSTATGTGTGVITVQAAPANNLVIGARADPDTITSSSWGFYRRVAMWEGTTDPETVGSIYKYAALGDSLTSGASATTRTPYPAILSRIFGPGQTVDNFGVWGTTTSYHRNTQWAAKMKGTGRYKALTYMGGVNDLATGLSLATMQANVGAILSEAKAEGMPVVAMTIAPWKGSTNWTAGRQTMTDQFNDWLKYVSTTNDYRLVDTYALLGMPGADPAYLDTTYANADKLHWTFTGENAVATEIRRTLNQPCTSWGATTNYAVQSETLNSLWGTANVTVNLNASVSPDGGTQTAEKITETAVNNVHQIQYQMANPAGAMTFSIYAKPAERTWMKLWLGAVAGNNYAFFDTAACAVGTVSGTISGYGARRATNGYCRVWITGTVGANDYVTARLASANGTDSYLGVVNSGMTWFGPQAERAYQPTPSPYILTGVTPVARIAGCYPNLYVAP